MTNATETLRRMLDEREVEYETNDSMGASETTWSGFTAYQLTPTAKLIMHLTPEQAIAATLERDSADVDGALELLDEIRQADRISYDDYSRLFDAIATLGGGKLTAEQVEAAIKRNFSKVAVIDDGGDKVEWREGWVCNVGFNFRAIADELNAALGGGECEWELEHSGTLYDKWRCSECKFLFVEPRCDQGYTDLVPNFCPNCGRRVKR